MNLHNGGSMGNFYPLSKIFLDFLNWKKSKNTKNSLNTLKYSYIVWIQKPQNNRNKWFKECFEKIFISQILNLLSRFRCDWLRLTLSHTKNSFPRFLRISKAYSCFNWSFCFRLNPGSFISHLLKLFFSCSMPYQMQCLPTSSDFSPPPNFTLGICTCSTLFWRFRKIENTCISHIVNNLNGVLGIFLSKRPSMAFPLSDLSLSIVNVASCHVVIFPCTPPYLFFSCLFLSCFFPRSWILCLT